MKRTKKDKNGGFLKSNNLLLLGARAPITLELARSFYNYGYKVVLADSLKFPIGRWSNKVFKYEILPNAREDTLKYYEAITRLVEKYSIEHIIPSCEEAFYIAKNKSNWNCKVWTSEIKLMDLLHNKETFALNFNTQLPIPKTTSLEKFSKWSKSNQYVFKPKYSRFGNKIIINSHITSETIQDPKNWIAQTKVCGKEVCVYSIWDDGKLKGYTCYEPLYRAGKGSGIFFKRIENEDIKEQVKCFGEAYKYTGQLSFDVIISKDNNWFIECNPRGTSGAHLLNKNLANCFFDSDEKTFIDKSDYMLAIVMFFTHPFKFFLKKVRRAKDVIFRIDDPLPALLQGLSFIEILFIKLSKGISLLEATTFDLEWNGDED